MKKIILAAALSFIASAAYANDIDTKCPQFSAFGAPVDHVAAGQYICKKNYAIHYRFDTKTAEYVVEHPTKAAVGGTAKRKDDFRPDPDIAKPNQSQLADYATAGNIYDRGHLVPAGDNTQSADIMSESFFLSNMVPQVANNNRGIWKQLETFVRTLAVEDDSIYVISGTIYDAGYTTIGANKVGVPTRLFKVIIDKKKNTAVGFIFPNKALPVGDLPKYKTTVAAVEKESGINFMPTLPSNLAGLKTIEPTAWNVK